jgi:hypothetical protein
MAHYRVVLNGTDVSVPTDDGSVALVGFYVTRAVRARDPSDAVEMVKKLVLDDWKSRRFVTVNDYAPELAAESVVRITMFDPSRFRRTGYVFYPNRR